ncbi:DNA adenine methylase [Clostridium tertium]|uniref:DNA adenine methylase n=1 Tax=Clostridium tertium TaxID=1559 RepID=UPI003BFA711B
MIAMGNIKPPINRMGGKSRLRKKIISEIPEHICYCEPFFGAGWVFFGKDKSEVEVINDRDRELINFFKVLKYHTKEVQRLLEYEIVARDTFYGYKDANIDEMTDIQRAIRFMYIINQSFASRGISFGYGALRKPTQKLFELDNLNLIRERLSNTFIENKDAIDIIKRYDREGTFFFIDPPYFETTGYSDAFEEDKQIELRDVLLNIKGKFLLTINANEKIREWYNGCTIEEVDVNYSVSRQATARKKYKELIIKNY